GWQVTLLEKNAGPGGRARVFEAQGFTFDMGPSWYWMPDVFEQYFAKFGKTVADYYELVRLDPSYQGGMHQIVRGMVAVAEELGVKIEYSQEVQEIVVENGRATGVRTASGFWPADAVVAGADYHHIEQQVLASEYRHYSPEYWDSRTMAPSSLLFYLGVSRKLANLQH
nr:hypothetical protein [Tanacetum cinerariifolium]